MSLPEAGFLYSIAGLSLTLAGFSGLVGAFRREGKWTPIDSYRLRQIPEMGLATTVIALITTPLADTTKSGTATIQIAAGLALVFTVGHIVALNARMRRDRVDQPRSGLVVAGVLDITLILVATICLALGGAVAYEWLLVLLLARPILAFALVVGRVAAG